MVSQRLVAPLLALAFASPTLGCSDSNAGGSDTDPSSGTDASGQTQGTSTMSATTSASTSGSNTTEPEPTEDDSSQADTSSSGAGDSGSGEVHDDCSFSESFDGLADGDPWPEYWNIDGGVALADVQGGAGRLRAEISSYSLARISVALDCTDVDATATFRFTDGSTQGAALYARTNGGYLRETDPPGEGYAAFAELFRDPSALGVWREVDGQEQMVGSQSLPLEPNVDYRMRFRLTQQDASTSLLQAKIWRVGEDEPGDWTVERTDETASLQGVGGGFALDAWSSGPVSGNDGADLFFDDIVVSRAE